MSYLSFLWSLIPVPIGLVCFYFSWRIRKADMRARYYSVLFLGLGIGAILLGGSFWHHSFDIVAKIMFFLTIAAAFIVRSLSQAEENRAAQDQSSLK